MAAKFTGTDDEGTRGDDGMRSAGQGPEAPVETPYGRILQFLRMKRGLKRKEVARRLGWSEESLLGRLENATDLARERLETILPFLPYPGEAVDALRFADALISREELPEPPSPVALTAAEREEVHRTTLAAAWSVAEALGPGFARAMRQDKAVRALAEAATAWSRLLPCAPAERRALVEAFPEYRTWAVAVKACEASVDAAADDAGEALELAELACWIAERVEEEPAFLSRLQGHCLGRRGNAHRVRNDFDRAGEDFARAWEFWWAGADADPPLLAEWQLLSLEASLCRDQQRSSEALDLLDRAMAASRGNRAAAGRILLQKEHVFEQMGDPERALAALAEAGPVIEECGDARLAFLHLFKTALNRCHLGHFAAVAELWPRVRELASQQARKLEKLRVKGVEARLRAGLGERLEAMALFVEVQREFTRLKLPYDAALVSLELAVLWLKVGRTAEVRELALEMAWIFKAKGIAREALAALRLFCEAAERDAATVELTRRVIAEIEKARRLAPRPERGTRGRG
jgi:tetratricopeptide (TPR) repeat protein